MLAIAMPTQHFGRSSRVVDIVPNAKVGMEIAEVLLLSGAYRVMLDRPQEIWPTWKMGIKAPVYCNCRDLLAVPGARKTVVRALADAIEEFFPEAEAIVGVASAGVGWAAAVADTLDFPVSYALNEPKSHGLGGRVQGGLPKGLKVVLVDDLVASGGSLLKAKAAVETECCSEVIGVQSIVNWGFDKMRKNLEGLCFKALTSYSFIVAEALLHGLISETDMKRLLDFYTDPSKGF